VVTPEGLRDALHAASPASDVDADALAGAAMRLGPKRRSRRRVSRGAVLAAAAVGVLGAYGALVPGTPPPAQAAISCFADRVVLAAPKVDARTTGARLTVTNATGAVLPLVVGDVAAYVPPGRSSVDMPMRPGRNAVTCGTSPAAALTVTDSGRVWVDDAVDCARPEVEDLRGVSIIEFGDPVKLTRGALRPPADATVEPAGYPGATDRRMVRVVHGGRVLAVAVWRAVPLGDSWTLDEVRRCRPAALAPF
jgi:hypothetical protein